MYTLLLISVVFGVDIDSERASSTYCLAMFFFFFLLVTNQMVFVLFEKYQNKNGAYNMYM